MERSTGTPFSPGQKSVFAIANMFLKLPSDVTVHILLELKSQDLLVCWLLTKHFDNIVRDSVELQYAAALVPAKVDIAQKLRALHAA